jgi:isocitrate dehydrogenase kinase/phosphatase
MKTLYEITGDIKDINTMLVPREKVRVYERDKVRLDYLNQNFFHRENVDWITGKLSKTHNMWVFFAPIGVQGDIRRVLDKAQADYYD